VQREEEEHLLLPPDDPPLLERPTLRGALHLGALPVSVVAGTWLVLWAPAGSARISCLIYALTAVLLFGCSALYHRGRWTPPVKALLRRLDHANIFVFIAGSYTPLAVLALEGTTRTAVLVTVWTGAVLGLLFRVVWMGAPRWLYVPLYVGLGWVAVGVTPALWRGAGGGVVLLLVVGGLGYTLGALAYAFKRPDPWPRTFGYHEVFHTGTLVGWAAMYAAVVLTVAHTT
jgi:hemolysin III